MIQQKNFGAIDFWGVFTIFFVPRYKENLNTLLFGTKKILQLLVANCLTIFTLNWMGGTTELELDYLHDQIQFTMFS